MSSVSRPETDQLLAEAGFVHRLARALVHDRDLAHDVAQDALAAALQQRQPQNLRAWLAAVTRRLAGKTHRARAERKNREALAAPPEADERAERTAERLRLHRRLTEAVLRLPEPYRTAVTMRFFDALTPRAIAVQTHQSSDVVRQQVHRGLVLLRQQLDAEFGDRRAWLGAFVGAGWVGAAASPWVLVWVLAMKKIVAAAVCVVALGSWWLWPREDATAPAANVNAAVVAASAESSPSPDAADAAGTPTTQPMDSPQRVAVVCEVHVVDDADNAIADAEVHCWSATGDDVLRRTDATGLATFGTTSGPGGVVVFATGRQPLVQELPERLGNHEIVMAAGLPVAGQLLVDGRPAAAGWRLKLNGRRAAIDPRVPKSLAERLTSGTSSETMTTTGGAFSFVGLAADWRGGLELPSALWLLPESGGTADDHTSLTIDGPATNLLVCTTQLQTVAGRVLWEDTGEPVRSPRIHATYSFEPRNTPMNGQTGDEAGRFAIGFEPTDVRKYLRWCKPEARMPLARVQLQVFAAGSDGTTTVDLTADQLVPGTEHVVRLRRASASHFLALDRRGAPIPGARVLALEVSEPAGADGRGTFPGKPTDLRLVGAPGFRIGPCSPRAPAKGTRDDPLVFELDADNRVELRLQHGSGTPPPVSVVVVRGTAALFAGSRHASDLDKALLGIREDCGASGCTQPDGSSRMIRFTCTLRPAERRDLVLHSLEPGLRCTAAAVDALGHDLVTREFVTPPFGESIDIDLLVPGTPRRIGGAVLDSARRPIAGAEVVASLDVKDAYATTDQDGAFRFDAIYSDAALQLTVTATGFVGQRRAGLLPADDRENLEFTLETGRTVTVRVLDEAGASVPILARPLEVVADGAFDHLGEGEVRWRELPSGIVTFACEIGRTQFTVQHDTAEPNAILSVPKPARLLVTTPRGWQKPADAIGVPFARITRLDAAEPPRTVAVDRAETEATLLLPGRYRLELLVRERPQGTIVDLTERVLGPGAEVTLVAGQFARVELR